MGTSNWPRSGMPRSGVQTPKKALNVKRGPERKFVGGGGMAVGSMRTAAGVAKEPSSARAALLRGMQG